jgi:hypothetical protein
MPSVSRVFLEPEMRQRTRIVPIPDKNDKKYFSYREAWGRIRKAQGHGFYLEAVTLEESIMADRLISFLVRTGAAQPTGQLERRSFGQLIDQWMRVVPEPIVTKDFPDLGFAVNEWRKQRNFVVHGMVKSVPGTDHSDVRSFLREAEQVAARGAALADVVTGWCKKAKRQFQKNGST